MPNGNTIVADNNPDISVAVDDHALPGRRVAGSSVRAGFGTPLRHASLIDQPSMSQTSRVAGWHSPATSASGFRAPYRALASCGLAKARRGARVDSLENCFALWVRRGFKSLPLRLTELGAVMVVPPPA